MAVSIALLNVFNRDLFLLLQVVKYTSPPKEVLCRGSELRMVAKFYVYLSFTFCHATTKQPTVLFAGQARASPSGAPDKPPL